MSRCMLMESFYIQNTFQAYVDAIIPRTPRLAEEYGRIQYYGAIDLQVEQFLIYELDRYPIPMAEPTAGLLNAAATRLRQEQGYAGEENFAALSPLERLMAIDMLGRQMVDPDVLPAVFQADPGLIPVIVVALFHFTLMGYYSEWSGYGSTRLGPPEERVLEFKPVSWMQIDYPGPSLGYRVSRPFRFA